MTTLKEALDQLAKGHELDNEQKKLIIDKWQKELGVQPCKDCISRRAALDIYDDYNVAVENGELEAYRKHRKRLQKLPHVQPKYNTDEWCKTCREYDQEKHCCPRFNRVIRNAVEEIKQPNIGHWIANAPQYDMLNPQYICSECGNAHTRITPYCEMCGARMVEPQESEDEQ